MKEIPDIHRQATSFAKPGATQRIIFNRNRNQKNAIRRISKAIAPDRFEATQDVHTAAELKPGVGANVVLKSGTNGGAVTSTVGMMLGDDVVGLMVGIVEGAWVGGMSSLDEYTLNCSC